MYSINGVALHDLSGPRRWGFLAESEPLADLTLARQGLTRQGRHGVLAIPGEVLEAPTIALAVWTPREHLETLLALLRAASTVTLTQAPVRELAVECMSVKQESMGPSGRDVRVTATLRLPEVAWRGPVTISPPVALTGPSVSVDVLSGISTEVQDAIVRVKGPVQGVRVTDAATGSWVAYPELSADQWLRVDGPRAWITTADTWSGGVEVSGLLTRNGPRRIFEVGPVLDAADPGVRTGRLVVSSVSRGAGAAVQVRARTAHLQAER